MTQAKNYLQRFQAFPRIDARSTQTPDENFINSAIEQQIALIFSQIALKIRATISFKNFDINFLFSPLSLFIVMSFFFLSFVSHLYVLTDLICSSEIDRSNIIF